MACPLVHSWVTADLAHVTCLVEQLLLLLPQMDVVVVWVVEWSLLRSVDAGICR